MDASPSHKLTDPARNEHEFDPKSPEFAAACRALIKKSPARGLPTSLGRLEGATEDAQVSALRDVWLRHAEDRAELEALRAEFTEVSARYEDTTTALKAASQEASQTGAQLAEAKLAIADRDHVIDKLRQTLAEREQQILGQDLLIEQLENHLLQVEEARAADASAILESLDRYRT